MKKIVIIIVIVLLASTGLWLVYQKLNNDVMEKMESENSQQQNTEQSSNINNNDTNSMELKIEITQKGNGDREVKPGDTISVQYTGKLTDGTKFDSSYDRNQPFTFTIGVGQVIQGWEEGIMGMQVGEKRTITIPSDMGYGAAGAGDVIPPNTILIFDVELVSIQ